MFPLLSFFLLQGSGGITVFSYMLLGTIVLSYSLTTLVLSLSHKVLTKCLKLSLRVGLSFLEVFVVGHRLMEIPDPLLTDVLVEKLEVDVLLLQRPNPQEVVLLFPIRLDFLDIGESD